ncbi:hypothetical protein Tco_0307972 [Tanacetum coccineum]
MEKPIVLLPSSSLTLSSAKYGNQFLNDNADITPLVDTVVTILPEKTTHSPKQQPPQSKTKIIIKKPKQSEEKVDAEDVLQRLMKLEKKVEAMSKIDHTKAIDKSVQAHLKKVLLKDVPDFGKIKQEKVAKTKMPKYFTKLFDDDSLKDYDQNNKLMSLMSQSKSFKTHPSHQKLYDALMDSLLINEDDMDR